VLSLLLGDGGGEGQAPVAQGKDAE